MTQEHFCVEHNTPFFKTPRMKNFAHPVKDAAGNQILDKEGKPRWCSELEVKPTDILKPSMPEVGNSTPKTTNDREDSIEAQVAFKGVIELMVAGIVTREEPLGMSALLWAKVRLPPILERKPPEPSQSEGVTAATIRETDATNKLVPTSLTNPHDFMERIRTYAKENKKSMPGLATVCHTLGIERLTDITDFNKVWEDYKKLMDMK